MKTSHSTIDFAGAASVGQTAHFYNRSDVETRGESWGAVVAFGLWLRVGVAAVGLLLIGVVQLIGDDHVASVGIGLVAGGAALLAAAWHYARLALRRMEQTEASATRAIAPALTGEHDRSAREPIARPYRREYALD